MRHDFQRSPLSPGVPLEGSDTVLGLRQVYHIHRAEALKQTLGVSGGSRRRYERYRGPYLYQLTLDHLRQKPRAWPEFLYAPTRPGAAGGPAYNVPSHMLMLCERVEENIVHFLVNYITIAAAFGLHLILQHPGVLVSIVAMLACAVCGSVQPMESARAVAAPQRPQAVAEHSSVLRLLLYILAYVALALSGCGRTLGRCLPLLTTAILLHAVLRRAPSEYLARGGEGSGVPFRHVLGLRAGRREEEDSRRLFRELCLAAADCLSAATSYCWFSLMSWDWGPWNSLLPWRGLSASA